MAFTPFDPFENKESFTLDNGLTVVCLPLPYANQQACRLVINAGDYHGRNGLAHFTEHLVAESRGSGEATELRVKLAQIGGIWASGATGLTFSYYGFRAPGVDVDALRHYLDRLGKYVFGTTFDYDEEMIKEVFANEYLQRVLRQRPQKVYDLARLTDNPQHYFEGPKTSFGTPKIILERTREECEAFHQRYYNPQNAILITAGRLSGQELRELLEGTELNCFHRQGELGLPIPPYAPEPPLISKHAFALPEETLARIDISGYIPSTYSATATDAARNVLREISNNLLREEKALSYGVTAIILSQGDCYHLNWEATGIEQDKLEAFSQSLEELQHRIQTEEVDKVLSLWKTQYIQETSYSDYIPARAVDEAFDRYIENHRVLTTKEMIDAAQSVTPNQIREILGPIFSESAWQRWILPCGWEPPKGVPLLDIKETLKKFQASPQ